MAMTLSQDIKFEPITVVISTLNRGVQIVEAIKSILSNDYAEFDIIVVDQSDNNLTEEAIAPFLAHHPITYIHSHIKGLAHGHNLALSSATNELIAFTDDDCVVPTNWLSEISKAFKRDTCIGLVFGNVVSSRAVEKDGYTPVFIRDRTSFIKEIRSDLFFGMGIGACFGIKRSIWAEVMGFDEMLGPGAPLGSLEDRDIAIRVLLSGYYIYQTPDIFVIHYGFRPNSKLRDLAFQDWSGFGSSYAKYLKCGHWRLSYYLLVQMWLGRAVLISLQISYQKARLKRVTPVVAFWYGFVRGLLTPVNRKTTKFVTFKERTHSIRQIVTNYLLFKVLKANK